MTATWSKCVIQMISNDIPRKGTKFHHVCLVCNSGTGCSGFRCQTLSHPDACRIRIILTVISISNWPDNNAFFCVVVPSLVLQPDHIKAVPFLVSQLSKQTTIPLPKIIIPQIKPVDIFTRQNRMPLPSHSKSTVSKYIQHKNQPLPLTSPTSPSPK